jgi:hypothetical protein
MYQRTVATSATAACCALAAITFVASQRQTEEQLTRAEGFTLEIRGAEQYSDAIFDVQYALGSGFNFVEINGVRYRRIDRDVVMKESANNSPKTRYLVVNEVKHGRVIVQDQASGKNLASYKLHRDGWPGSKAAAWLVQKIGPIEPNVAAQALNKRHPQDWNVTVQSPTALLTLSDIRHPFVPITNCDSLIEYEPAFRENGFGEIRTKRWILARPSGFKGILCSEQGIFIFAGQGKSGFTVLWFSEDGNLIGRHSVHNPFASDISGVTWINHMSVESGILRTVQSYYWRTPTASLAAILPDSQTQFTIALGALAR